jgi:ubiquinone/menaquinone biosynthesis C-methylase UbiE
MAMVPSPEEVQQRLPAKYRKLAGIGPYYLPVFGRMYSKRLNDCLAAVVRHGRDPKQIVDVGCGLGIATAAIATQFPRAEVFGLDLYPEDVLNHAKDLMPGAQRVRFISGSAEDAPFEDSRFDLITAFDVLEHVPHPEIALRELARILSKDGVCIISVPIESPVLRALRYVALAGGRKGNINPHWEGTIRSVTEFKSRWREQFTPLEIFNTPFRWAPGFMNYDVVLVGKRGGKE